MFLKKEEDFDNFLVFKCYMCGFVETMALVKESMKDGNSFWHAGPSGNVICYNCVGCVRQDIINQLK